MAEIETTKGTAGLQAHAPGAPTTVSSVAGATGGIAPGHLVDTDIDEELFRFKSDDTPLMQLMLKAKKVKVQSPVVQHYMIDEPRSSVRTQTDLKDTGAMQVALPLAANEKQLPRQWTTLLAKDVDGYDESGARRTPGKGLLLMVWGTDPTTGNPIVRAINGKKDNPANEYCTVPAIPAGTKLVILSNALYETQKEVDPDLIIPQPMEVYLQKRGMNQIVSDYFESQKKRIPFAKALIAETAITNFKVRGNRTLYAGRKGVFKVDVPKMGIQTVFTTEGVRYQVKKELQHFGKWTIEELISLAKMAFTGEDVPKSMICLAGKNFLENIQTIDYSKHPEIQISSKKNAVGWTVTEIHTVFGNFELKHDPTLDRLDWSNSAFLVAPDRLVHYIYSAEHRASDRVEGEEATRESLLVWDALALKGSCHIWINGEDETGVKDAFRFKFWGSEEAPTMEEASQGDIFYLVAPCPGIAPEAAAGTLWQAIYEMDDDQKSMHIVWERYSGEMY